MLDANQSIDSHNGSVSRGELHDSAFNFVEIFSYLRDSGQACTRLEDEGVRRLIVELPTCFNCFQD